MKRSAMLLLLLLPGLAVAAKTPDVFYVYSDKANIGNHYIPSGWMGDYGDLKIDDADRSDPADGKTAIKWTYNAKRAQGAGWTGVFWQHPANNWGDKPGGFDLTGYKRLTFWAKGAKGGEVLTEVKVGGISGEFGDSGSVGMSEAIALTKEWKKYTIDLAGADLKHIIGGFEWSTNVDSNPDGFVIFLDEIRFEK